MTLAEGLAAGSLGLTIVLFVLGGYRAREDAAKERRLEALEDEQKDLSERVREAELGQRDIKGEVRAVSQGHTEIREELTGIREAMVPRTEWETRHATLEKTLDEVRGLLWKLTRASPPSGIPRPGP